ncbi:MAG TPA: hypothetical protein VN240_04240, partial [Propylenella sp.]|nr:hypothetical protein [Propylenella sp.]
MVSVSNAGRRRRSRLRRRLAQAGTLTARTLRRLAKFLRVPPGIAAKREFGRQGRDFLQIAERVSTAPAAVLAIICRGRAEAMERLLKAVERHTIGPYELLFVAAEDAGPDLRILLTRYGLRGNAKIVWSGSAEGSAADIVAACSVHAPGADLVVLGSTAQLGPRWLQKARLQAYLDEDVQPVGTFD